MIIIALLGVLKAPVLIHLDKIELIVRFVCELEFSIRKDESVVRNGKGLIHRNGQRLPSPNLVRCTQTLAPLPLMYSRLAIQLPYK